MNRKTYSLGAICLLTLLVGCMDGPFYQLKRINPYYLSTWKKDREHGPTYEDRLSELRKLERKLGKMSAEEQSEWANRLELIVREDASPELRATAAQIISKIDSPAAERALNTASTDEVDKVRMMACKAWRQRGGTAARDMLLSMAQADESSSVRQEAILALGGFNEPEVLRSLGGLLEDKSPAIQFSVAQSLASLTGESHGGDIDAWQSYLGENVGAPQPTKSMPPMLEVGNGEVKTASGVGGIPLPPLPR